MIRVVRVLTFLSFLLTVGVLFLCAVGPWSDPPTAIPIGPSALELYAQGKDRQGNTDNSPMPPLIQAAEKLASYLNPPPAPTPAPTALVPVKHKAIEVKPVSASAPFELQGISYHRLRPEESLALVSVVGDGPRWVRQGTQLGHCTIEQISANSIVYSAGGQRKEMALVLSSISGEHVQEHDTSRVRAVSGPADIRGDPQAPETHVSIR